MRTHHIKNDKRFFFVLKYYHAKPESLMLYIAHKLLLWLYPVMEHSIGWAFVRYKRDVTRIYL